MEPRISERTTWPALSHVRRLSERLVAWILAWADHPGGPIVLVVLALAEATVFPAPTEALLLALCVAQPRRALSFGVLAALASVLGGAIGYQVGARMFDTVGEPVMRWLRFEEYLPVLEEAYRKNAWLALITSGYTPVPYLLYTMAAGAFAVPLETFVAASAIGRGLKYAPLALLAWWLGPAVRVILVRYAAWVGLAVTLLVAVMIAWRLA